jgi:hypothetical protein
VALYFAIQQGDSRIVTSGAADAASLTRLYEITCREGTFGTWGCSVVLDDESRLSCTVDRVRPTGDDVEIDGRVHCKRD